mgnify:CR=1 FL=1
MAGIPQVITEDRASGAQFIDGSLKITSTSNTDGSYLTRTPSTAGNRKTWTWSGWVKREKFDTEDALFVSSDSNANSDYTALYFNTANELKTTSYQSSSRWRLTSNAVFRDIGWYHIVLAVDLTQGTNSNKVKLYVNGSQITSLRQEEYPSTDFNTRINSINDHSIGRASLYDRWYADFGMSQVYFLDGIVAGPEEFGYTDPLTNTWRPKKYEGDFKIIPDNQLLYNVNTGDNGFDSGTSSRTYDATGRTFTTYTTPQTANPGGNGANSAHVYKSPDGAAIDWVISTDTTDRYIWTSTDGVNWTNTGVQDTDGSPQTVNTAWLALAGGSNASNVTVTSSTAGYGLIVGHNSFYLPMDGNTPIGKDQSGVGNDWTPIRFGGSNSLEKATGAIPILNTNGGGTVARSGVRTDKKTYTVTVSGGKYYLDGVLTPSLNFLRGGTYIFDYTAASGHPFKFSTTSDGTHGGGSEYTDGTNTSTTNVMKITVPHNAPDTLYYYCSAHSGMGSSINVTTDIRKADPYAWKCVLALPLLGSKDDVSASINVNSTTKTTAITGNAEPRSDRWDIYSGAFYFDSTADYIEVTPTSGTTLADNTAPYTIEFFFSMNNGRLTDNTYNLMWSTSSGLSIAKWRSGVSNKVYFESDGNGTGWNITSQEDIDSIRWYHFAAVRDGNTITTYLDGVRQGTATSTYSASAETWWRVGGQNANSSCHAGYMQDFRIYNGVAKYTEDFSRVSTTPDVLPDTPSGVSGGSKLAKITDGAVAFDGSNDNLTISAHSDLDLSSGDFTVEGFVYPKRSQEQSFVTNWNSGGQFQVQMSSSGTLQASWAPYSTSQYAVTGTTPIAVNAWSHFAYTRSGSTFELFLDGVSQGTQTSSANGSTNNNIVLGENGGNADRDLLGFLSNVRIIKGTALYTSDFTPPTAPLTNVTNTKLLCCQSNTSAGAAAVSPNISGINDGTVWSHYVTGDIDSSNPGYQAFDGNTSNIGCRTINAGGASIAWHPPSPIAFSSSFKIYCAKDGTANATRFLVVHAGGTTDFSDSVVTSTTQTAVDLAQIAGVTSPISKIAIVSGGANPRFSAIEVDNTILVDPVSPIGGSTATTFNPFTDDIDATRGQESAYATFNPIQMCSSGAALSDGNLKIQTSSNVWKATQASIGMKTGKFYCEFGPNLWRDNNNHCQPGVRAINLTNLAEMGGSNYSAFYHYTGTKFFNGPGGAGTSFGAAWNDSQYNIIGIAFDADTRKVWFSKNGVWQGGGNPSAGTNEAGIINLYGDGTYAFTLGTHGNSGLNGGGAHANFGQKPFKYAPPDGFQPVSLSTTQQEKVIARPDKYAGIAIYDGTGSAQTINLGFKPDLMWCKTRSHSVDHKLVDSVRGLTKVQESNNNRQDSTTTTGITATDSSGFSVGSSSDFNTNGRTYVTWGWRAGGSGSQPFYKDDVGYANASDVNMSVGSLNNDAYDQRETWSNGVTSSAGAWPGGFNTACGAVTNGFNGNTSNGVCATGAASIVWNNPQTTSTLSGKLEFYNRSDTTTYSRRIIIVHAGGTSGRITLTPNSSWQDLGTYTNITSIIITGDNPGGGVIDAIKVDGKLLVDAGASVTNVPSIANIGASIGTKNGFSILKYAGSGSNGTIAHGLSQAPDFFFGRDLEDTSNSRDWIVYHRDIGATGRAKFNNNAESVSSVFFQDTSPTDSVISVGTSNDINSSNDYILYCWHDIPGLQKFGSYVNPSSSDGAFVELGFKPAILIYKCVRNISSSSGAGDWMIIDTTRSPANNPSDMNNLSLNVSNGEDSYYSASQGAIDILSNGFKIRHPNSSPGGDPGRLYIYAAWAEAPTVNLYGGHANAR